MPTQEDIEFIHSLLVTTWALPDWSVWDKFKFSVWLFLATTPAPPVFF